MKVILDVIKRGVDVNICVGDCAYPTALILGASRRDPKSVEWLLAHGADPNLVDVSSISALKAAAAAGDLASVQLLLEHGADINAQGGEFHTAIQAASFKGNLGIVELLLARGADIHMHGGQYGTALQAAIVGNSSRPLEMVKLLLDRGADLNLQGTHYSLDLRHLNISRPVAGRYDTALQAAAYKGRLAIVEHLLARKAEVNAQGGEFGTALQAASRKHNPEIVDRLLGRKAKANIEGGKYGTALRAAVAGGPSWFTGKGQDESVEVLLTHGADPNLGADRYGSILDEFELNRIWAPRVSRLLRAHGAV
ncbi:ankyrin repeat-containing domain protein [Mycena polygramma]|nr:ankyrin repeat-containing domain protein [Mycena polygramma]